jgi:protein-disulfide isomerase
VTIVAFLDYNSPDCRAAAAALRSLRKADKGVRIVFKELPMPGSSDDFAARAVLAARKQDKHLQLQWAISQGQSEMTETAMIEAAGLAGLDVRQLRRDMADPAIAAAIDQNRILARELGIKSMPAFIVGYRFYRGPVDLEHLQSAVAQAKHDAAS